MNEAPVSATAPQPTRSRRRGRPPAASPRAPRPAKISSPEARRMAAAILEVLAGLRTPTDAAAALAVSLPRYYQLEQRAVEGLVAACEPRPHGRGDSAARRIARLERELSRCQRDCARHQALVRAAQRTVGLLPSRPSPPALKPSGRKMRSRRPTVRALRAAKLLRAAGGDGSPAAAGAPAADVVEQPASGGS